MNSTEILTVRFHFGGEFVHIGKKLDYVGGDEAISEIQRDKLSLQEVLGFLKDHMEFKESMKLYFLHPGKELVNGLVFLYDDLGCLKMSEHTIDGGVADIYVEYHGQEDVVSISSGSDFEHEIAGLADCESDISDVPEVMTATDDESDPTSTSVGQLENVFVPDDYGLTQVMSFPNQNVSVRRSFVQNYVRRDIDTGSQGMTGNSQVINSSMRSQVEIPFCKDKVLRDVDTDGTKK
jgi:hypothetical protein